jgi:hypothetical protein
MKTMQCTPIETANDDGLLREGGSSVKRVVIREDLMKDRTPLVKGADVYLHASFGVGRVYNFCGSETVKTPSYYSDTALPLCSSPFAGAIWRPSEREIKRQRK